MEMAQQVKALFAKLCDLYDLNPGILFVEGKTWILSVMLGFPHPCRGFPLINTVKRKIEFILKLKNTEDLVAVHSEILGDLPTDLPHEHPQLIEESRDLAARKYWNFLKSLLIVRQIQFYKM